MVMMMTTNSELEKEFEVSDGEFLEGSIEVTADSAIEDQLLLLL